MKSLNSKIIGSIIVLVLFISIIAVLTLPKRDNSKLDIIEVQELYGDIIPYEGMSYGDTIISKEIFQSLLKADNFEITCELADSYTVHGTEITVKINKSNFKLPDGEKSLTVDDIIKYYEALRKMSDASMINNPAITNLLSVHKVDSSTIKFNFASEKAINILALTEYIGYEVDGKWYGTKNSVLYEDTGIVIGDTKYINANTVTMSEKTRISTMVFANADRSDGIKKENIPNGAFGFLTWSSSCDIGLDDRKQIIEALNKSDIRDNIEIKADSIYTGTPLYKEINNLTDNNDLKNFNTTINIGVANLGSYKLIEESIAKAFEGIGLNVNIKSAELSELAQSDEFDMIYVRLQRGKSPDFTSLLTDNGFIGEAGYSSQYTEYIDTINRAKTWDELCETLSNLDQKMREDGAWLFIDQAFDIKTTR